MSRFDRMLATILCKHNVMSEDQREPLIAECEQQGLPLPSLLLRKHLCEEAKLLAAVADELSCHPILLDRVTPSPEALEMIPAKQCLKSEVLPLSRLGNTLTLAITNPFDEPCLDQIRSSTGCEIMPVLSSSPSLRRKLKACFPYLPIEDEPIDEKQESGSTPAVGQQSSWMNLAEELEKEASQPVPPVSQPAPESGVEGPGVEQGLVTAAEVQLDLEDTTVEGTEPPPQVEVESPVQLTPTDESQDQQVQEPPLQTEAPSMPEPQAPPTPEEPAIQMEEPERREVIAERMQEPATADVQVDLQTEPDTQPEADVQADTQPLPQQSEEQVETQTESPSPQPEPQREAAPSEETVVPSASTSSRTSWDDVVDMAPARSAQVSWWRAAEAGVPPTDETMQGEEAQALELVRAFLLEAFERGFEELVFDAAEDGLHILERSARILQPLTVAPRHLQKALLSRIKWMAGLCSEERHPRTGAFLAAARGREYVCRLHALPTIHGERLQIELLESKVFSADLDALGIAGDGADDYRWAISNPTGLLLLSAPPGHGREPTLRALLGLSRPNGEQAVALENPVLVRLPGVTQVPVGRGVGLGTAEALRTVLRRAPERLLISDIRDAETARLAIQAAASGSLVLAGMDAPDVFCALARLSESGLPPFTLASSLRLAASQRGLRKLCTACRVPVPANRERLLAAGCRDDELGQAQLHQAAGCQRCHHGYMGWIPVFETLRITGDLRRMVASGAPVTECRNKTLGWGFRSLRHAALRLVLRGETSLEEILVATPEVV